MGRRRQVSDEQISLAAREVFLDRGPKAPVAMVAKKLGVSTATLFQRTGSKQQLMLMALQPEVTAIRELDRGVLTDTPIREQLTRILVEVNEYLGTIIGGSITLRAARIEHELPEPTPFKVRALLSQWLMQAGEAKLLEVVDPRVTRTCSSSRCRRSSIATSSARCSTSCSRSAASVAPLDRRASPPPRAARPITT
jgi:AcrR family transcriptional regulator